MKFQVIGINEEGEYVGYNTDIFNTQELADQHIKECVEEVEHHGLDVEFHIVKIIEKGD